MRKPCILYQARDFAAAAIARFPDNKLILGAYCEVGIKIYGKSADYTVFDVAMKELKAAEVRIGDPDISRLIRRLEQKMSGQPQEEVEC